jgi:hypothetical protein
MKKKKQGNKVSKLMNSNILLQFNFRFSSNYFFQYFELN